MILCYAALKPRDFAGRLVRVSSASYQEVRGRYKGKPTRSTLCRGAVDVDGVTDKRWGALWLPKELDSFFGTMPTKPGAFTFKMVAGEPMPDGRKTYLVDLLTWSGEARLEVRPDATIDDPDAQDDGEQSHDNLDDEDNIRP